MGGSNKWGLPDVALTSVVARTIFILFLCIFLLIYVNFFSVYFDLKLFSVYVLPAKLEGAGSYNGNEIYQCE